MEEIQGYIAAPVYKGSLARKVPQIGRDQGIKGDCNWPTACYPGGSGLRGQLSKAACYAGRSGLRGQRSKAGASDRVWLQDAVRWREGVQDCRSRKDEWRKGWGFRLGSRFHALTHGEGPPPLIMVTKVGLPA
eukprot:scaffold59830_cov17-Tisochrysis_lutea.AAC.2